MSAFPHILKTRLKLFLGKGSVRSWGQNGEDAVVQSLLHGIKNGFYVDVGAYDPVLYSNTYAFYRRGWRGVVIDANKEKQNLFAALRPRDTFVHTGIARDTGMKTYYRFSDGAYNTFDAIDAEKCKTQNYPQFIDEEKVAVRPLVGILREQRITNVDFLNIDIEGLDMEALESYDWSMPPRIIAIESRAFNPDRPADDPAYRFLKEKGYVLVGLATYTLIFTRLN